MITCINFREASPGVALVVRVPLRHQPGPQQPVRRSTRCRQLERQPALLPPGDRAQLLLLGRRRFGIGQGPRPPPHPRLLQAVQQARDLHRVQALREHPLRDRPGRVRDVRPEQTSSNHFSWRRETEKTEEEAVFRPDCFPRP